MDKVTKKRIAFDLDNTLCKGYPYKNAEPNQEMIDLVNQIYDEGHDILIFTGRGMKTYGQQSKAVSVYWHFTYEQIKKWGIKFTELIFGKPDFDLLVDDKVVNSKNIKTKEDVYRRLP